MLGTNANAADSAGTSMLYAGEQFDTSLQMYYNRARYYDQSTGRFNRMDPYAGSNQDPQSLHKYLYVHANPVNGIDPTGEQFFSMSITLSGLLWAALFVAVVVPVVWLAWKYILKPIVAKVYPVLLLCIAKQLQDKAIKEVINQLDIYWPNHNNAQRLKSWLDLGTGTLDVRVLPDNRWVEGLNVGRIIAVPQRAIDERDYLALTLVMYAEWQHYPEGGGLKDTQETQNYFADFRRMLPDELRTQYINSLHHGKTKNSY